jgi:PEP-CTERM motif
LTQLTLEAFSPAHVSLGSITSAFGSNVALSGDPGSAANEFLQLAFASGLGSVTITGSPAGGSFVLDDALLTALPTDPQPVPEPGTLGLALLGAAAWRAQRTRNRRISASN